jgi:FixJ family two-component response regulator
MMNMPPALPDCVDINESNVIICDEDFATRNLITELLFTKERTVTPLSSSQQLLDHKFEDLPTCLVLETHYASIHGLELQRRLMTRVKSPQIVFLTACKDVPTVVEALQAGAVDYLTKPFAVDPLLRAVNLAVERDTHRRHIDRSDEKIMQLLASLTPRELQVMALVATGLLNKQIAYQLAISVVTVKMHRGKLMQKLGLRSIVELVRILDKSKAVSDRTPASHSGLFTQPSDAKPVFSLSHH